MFGKNNMQEMMAKLQEMQGAVSESKKKLENIYVKGETDDGNIRFIMDGNRIVKEITIKDEALKKDKEELIEELIIAFNKAIKDADHVNENEMRNTAFNMFPGMGG